MPTLFEWRGWKFHFYSQDRGEPPHVHIRKDRREAKIWLESLKVARNRRCSELEINALLDVLKTHQNAFLEKWHEHFGN